MKITQMEVTLIDHMGTDLSVVDAARVSFNKQSEWVGDDYGNEVLSDRDAKLVGYLAVHNHFTTFCHCFATFRIKAPIFVARQLVKHQVGLAWSEVSRRYVDEEPEFWFPKVWRVRPDGSIKQGSGGDHPATSAWAFATILNVGAILKLYDEMIKDGVAPEQARMVLPLNTMTEWIWSGSLAAWARVCKLRLDPHAQVETREVAEKIDAIMPTLYPVAWTALMA